MQLSKILNQSVVRRWRSTKNIEKQIEANKIRKSNIK